MFLEKNYQILNLFHGLKSNLPKVIYQNADVHVSKADFHKV